jgi:dihydrofolate reductase
VIGLIWAQAENRVIGANGSMPWHLPEDLKHFAEVTAGATVIMGRKTWDSLPARYRPLPGRRNIVVTRQGEWAADGAEAAASVDEALVAAGDTAHIWAVGGRQIYDALIDRAHILEVTEIQGDVDGDTFAPKISGRWNLTARGPWAVSKTGRRYRFTTYDSSAAHETTMNTRLLPADLTAIIASAPVRKVLAGAVDPEPGEIFSDDDCHGIVRLTTYGGSQIFIDFERSEYFRAPNTANTVAYDWSWNRFVVLSPLQVGSVAHFSNFDYWYQTSIVRYIDRLSD